MEQYLIFDIETAPADWESLSESQQEYLMRGAETDEEKERKKFEMALSPLTAQVVCIGCQLMERSGGGWKLVSRAAFSADPAMKDDQEPRHVKLSTGDECHFYTEKKLLESFWAILKKYPRAELISFNGRGFDAPFLMLRSAIYRIRPSRNLMQGTKFNYGLHTDLIDELTFYTPQKTGPTRRFNFDFYTRAFGITSPKSEGVDGSMVGELYNNGELEIIAEYCMRDINATWELFLVWYNYLKY